MNERREMERREMWRPVVAGRHGADQSECDDGHLGVVGSISPVFVQPYLGRVRLQLQSQGLNANLFRLVSRTFLTPSLASNYSAPRA